MPTSKVGIYVLFKGVKMGTIIYCNSDECENTDADSKIYEIDGEFAVKLSKNFQGFHKYGSHVCEDCMNNYYNEEEELMKLQETFTFPKVIEGKDFKD